MCKQMIKVVKKQGNKDIVFNIPEYLFSMVERVLQDKMTAEDLAQFTTETWKAFVIDASLKLLLVFSERQMNVSAN